MGKSWGKVKGFSNNDPRWFELVEELKLKDHDKEWVYVRPVGPAQPVAQHWLETKKKKQFSVICRNFNPETEDFEDNGCPYCEAQVKVSVFYLGNFIVRDIQEERPATIKKGGSGEGFRTLDDAKKKIWSPIRVIYLPSSAGQQLAKIMDLNKYKTKDGSKKVFPPEHPKRGCDLIIMFDSTKTAQAKYQIQKGDASPLTEEELDYKLFDLTGICAPPSLEKAKQDLIRTGVLDSDAPQSSRSIDDRFADDDDDDDDDDPPVSKNKKTKKSVDVDDDDDDDPPPKSKKKKPKTDPDDDDDDDDPPPPPKKSKKKPVDDPDDDDDDPPPPPKKSKKKPKTDPDDDDDDDDDSFDDDDKEAVSSSKKKVGKKKPKDDDDDDSFDDDDDDNVDDASSDDNVDDASEDKPKCYGNFTGKVKCVKCKDKAACSEASDDADDD